MPLRICTDDGLIHPYEFGHAYAIVANKSYPIDVDVIDEFVRSVQKHRNNKLILDEVIELLDSIRSSEHFFVADQPGNLVSHIQSIAKGTCHDVMGALDRAARASNGTPSFDAFVKAALLAYADPAIEGPHIAPMDPNVSVRF
jgi:hypothetical protein